jgi:hypothetical protein
VNIFLHKHDTYAIANISTRFRVEKLSNLLLKFVHIKILLKAIQEHSDQIHEKSFSSNLPCPIGRHSKDSTYLRD